MNVFLIMLALCRPIIINHNINMHIYTSTLHYTIEMCQQLSLYMYVFVHVSLVHNMMLAERYVDVEKES